MCFPTGVKARAGRRVWFCGSPEGERPGPGPEAPQKKKKTTTCHRLSRAEMLWRCQGGLDWQQPPPSGSLAKFPADLKPTSFHWAGLFFFWMRGGVGGGGVGVWGGPAMELKQAGGHTLGERRSASVL